MKTSLGYNRRLGLCLALVAALTLGFCWGAAWFVEAESRALGGEVAAAAEAAAAEDWPQALLRLAQAHSQWQDTRRIWLGLMNHQEVSNIDLAFDGAAVYLEQRVQADTLAQLRQLRYYLELAVESDRLCWHNLF